MRSLMTLMSFALTGGAFAQPPVGTSDVKGIYPQYGGMTTPPGPEWPVGKNNLLYIDGPTNGLDVTRFTFDGALCSHAVQLKTGVHLYIVGIKYGFVRVRWYDSNRNQVGFYLIDYPAPRIGGPPAAARVPEVGKPSPFKPTKADIEEIEKYGSKDLKAWAKQFQK